MTGWDLFAECLARLRDALAHQTGCRLRRVALMHWRAMRRVTYGSERPVCSSGGGRRLSIESTEAMDPG